MKKIAFILFLSSILASCMSNKDQFKITGSVKGVDTGMIFLQKYDSGRWIDADSSKLKNGEFTFSGKVDFPEMWQFSMQENQVLVPFFLENAKIGVQIYPDSLEKSTIKGSATHDIYQRYLTMNEAINMKMEDVYKELNKAKEANDTVGIMRNDSIMASIDAEMKKQLRDFARTNNKTVVSPYLVWRNNWQFELPELEDIVKGMDSSLNQSQYMKILHKRVEILRSVAVGQPAPDFTMNDSTGKPVTLSSLKGKVLLVDFWASWCRDCRAENPNVVKAFEAFSKKGFGILGCSLDQDREKWLKGVKDQKLTWTQVSDLKGFANGAGRLYGVSSIPANVLLDKDQKIIARNLHGEDLIKKLEELLGPSVPEKKLPRRR